MNLTAIWVSKLYFKRHMSFKINLQLFLKISCNWKDTPARESRAELLSVFRGKFFPWKCCDSLRKKILRLSSLLSWGDFMILVYPIVSSVYAEFADTCMNNLWVLVLMVLERHNYEQEITLQF